MAGLRAGVAYVDIHGRLTRSFDRDLERDAAPRMSQLGSNLGGILAGGMAAAGAAAGVALVGGFTTAVSNEQAGDRLSAQLGVSGENAEFFGRVAGDLYAGAWGDSLATVGDSVRQVWQNGLVPEDVAEDDFERITALALDFTSTFEQDMAMTTASVGQMLRTGLAGSAEEAFDLLTRGAQQGADKAGDLVETFNEYGTQFRQLGLSGAEAMGLLVQGVNAGARDADIVADALKEFAIRAQDGSETTAEGFRLIGLNAEEMAAAVARGGPDAARALDTTIDRLREIEDPALQAQAAVALFGTQSEDLQDALYALDPTTAVAGLGEVEGAAQQMSDTLNDNLGTRLESIKRRGLDALAGFMEDRLFPLIDRFGPVVEDAVGRVVDAWPQVQAAVEPIIERIVALVEERWPQIQAVISDVMTTAREIISGALEAVQVLWDNFGGYIVEFVTSTFDAVMRVVSGALEVIRGIVDLVLGLITGDWSRAWDGVKAILSGAWEVIVGLIEGAIARARVVLQIGLDVLKGIFSGAWDAIVTGVSGALDAVVLFFTALPGRLTGAVGDVFGFLWDSFKDAMNRVIRMWNDFSFSINVPDFLPGPDEIRFDTPNINEIRDDGGSTVFGRNYLIGPVVEMFSPGRGHVMPQEQLIAGLLGADERRSGGQVVNVTVNNPAPEPASTSLPRAARKAAQQLVTA